VQLDRAKDQGRFQVLPFVQAISLASFGQFGCRAFHFP
jgi:hypothetical protein